MGKLIDAGAFVSVLERKRETECAGCADIECLTCVEQWIKEVPVEDKVDFMDAVMFLKEKERMCEKNMREHFVCAGFCELGKAGDKTGDTCKEFIRRYPEKAVAIVGKWSQENPVKTILSDFLEKYPNAKTKKSGAPNSICVASLGFESPHWGECREDYCKECWNQPLEWAGK